MEAIKVFSLAALVALFIASTVAFELLPSSAYVASRLAQGPSAIVITDNSLVRSPNNGVSLANVAGISVHAQSAATIATLKQLHVSLLRTDVHWAEVENTKGVYDFSHYGQFIQLAVQNHIRCLLTLDYGNSLYTGADSNAPEDAAQQQAFANFAAAAANYFSQPQFGVGKGIMFEIYNEPWSSEFWMPYHDTKTNATEYASLDRLATNAIHKVNPALLVTSASIDPKSSNASAASYTYYTDFLTGGGGGNDDALAIHPYRSAGPETVADYLATYQSLTRHDLHRDAPIWNTEWGYPVSDSDQAALDARLLLTTWQLGMPVSILYELQDQSSDIYGMYDRDGTIRPSGSAIETLMGLNQGLQLAGSIKTSQSSLYALEAKGKNEKLLMLWDPKNTESVQIRIPGYTVTHEYDELGVNHPLSSILSIGSEPTYVLLSLTHTPSAQTAPPAEQILILIGLALCANGFIIALLIRDYRPRSRKRVYGNRV